MLISQKHSLFPLFPPCTSFLVIAREAKEEQKKDVEVMRSQTGLLEGGLERSLKISPQSPIFSTQQFWKSAPSASLILPPTYFQDTSHLGRSMPWGDEHSNNSVKLSQMRGLSTTTTTPPRFSLQWAFCGRAAFSPLTTINMYHHILAGVNAQRKRLNLSVH